MARIASFMNNLIFILVGFFIGVSMVFGCLRLAKTRYKPSFGIVDTQALVQFEAEKLAKESPQKKLSSEKLEEIADALKQKVKLFAHFNDVVVLAKGAVWAGNLPDYTEMILEDVKELDHESQFE